MLPLHQSAFARPSCRAGCVEQGPWCRPPPVFDGRLPHRGTHFREVLLSKPAAADLGKVVANDLARDLDGKVDDRAREFQSAGCQIHGTSRAFKRNDVGRPRAAPGKNL